MDHQRRLRVGQQVEDGFMLAQIICLAQGDKDLARAALPQRLDDVPAQETRAAGHDDALFVPLNHGTNSSSAASSRARNSICSRLTTISIATLLWPPPGMITSA